jgi:hypothetical protein
MGNDGRSKPFRCMVDECIEQFDEFAQWTRASNADKLFETYIQEVGPKLAVTELACWEKYKALQKERGGYRGTLAL